MVLIPNWYYNAGEVGPGAAASVTCSIEYPAGTFTRVTFSGSNTGSIPSGGQLTSDAFNVTIPKGAVFYVRIWRSCSAGITYCGNLPFSSGDAMTYGNSVADQTAGGTVASSGGAIWGHAAIVGSIQQPSVYLLGDSRCLGRGDTADASGDLGELARSIGPSLPYINGGVSGQPAQAVRAAGANQLALSKFCTHVICELGINDFIVNNRTVAQLVDDLTNGIYPTFGASGKPIYQTTITPATSSTDSFKTVANQTDRTSGKRATFNDQVRAGLANATGFFDVAPTVENTKNGVWTVNGNANYATADGVHETNAAYLLIKNSGVINPALFTR